MRNSNVLQTLLTLTSNHEVDSYYNIITTIFIPILLSHRLEPLQLERECNSTPKLQLYSIVEKDDDMDILKDLFFSSTDQCGR